MVLVVMVVLTTQETTSGFRIRDEISPICKMMPTSGYKIRDEDICQELDISFHDYKISEYRNSRLHRVERMRDDMQEMSRGRHLGKLRKNLLSLMTGTGDVIA